MLLTVTSPPKEERDAMSANLRQRNKEVSLMSVARRGVWTALVAVVCAAAALVWSSVVQGLRGILFKPADLWREMDEQTGHLLASARHGAGLRRGGGGEQDHTDPALAVGSPGFARIPLGRAGW